MKTINKILKELAAVSYTLDIHEYHDLTIKLKEKRRFFFLGEGRSGLIAKVAAMRLMHTGKQVYVVGETTTPAIEKRDLLIVISGSATSVNIVNSIEKAIKSNAEIFLVTTNDKSVQYHKRLLINAATKLRKGHEPGSFQPLGNQFDQFAHLVLDAAIIDSLKEDNPNLNKYHNNLE